MVKLFDAKTALEAFDANERDGRSIFSQTFKIIRAKLESAAKNSDWDYIFEIVQEEHHGRKALLQQLKPYTKEDYLVSCA